jgi:hypothetical protein
VPGSTVRLTPGQLNSYTAAFAAIQPEFDELRQMQRQVNRLRMRVQLTHTEATAKRIQGQLELGVTQWERARADFLTERDRLVGIIIQIRNTYTQHEWFCVILILAAVFIFGIVDGMRIER